MTVLVGICAEVLTVLSTSMASEAEPPVLILGPKSHSDCDQKIGRSRSGIISQVIYELFYFSNNE